MFDLASEDVWTALGKVSAYRFVLEAADYGPGEPWVGNGRFDNGTTPTLYLSLSPEGSVAEYFRRHPEFLNFLGDLKIRLYEFQVTSLARGLDVSHPDLAIRVGIPWLALTSSDSEPTARYRECRSLARVVVSRDCESIKYPSAAYTNTINVVLFATDGFAWTISEYRKLKIPEIDPDAVTVLSQLPVAQRS